MGKLVSAILKMMISGGAKAAGALEEATRNPKAEQEKLLQSILTASAGTELGREFDFASINSPEEYSSRIPLTDYDFYSEKVERMMKGERNILSSAETVHFNVTSGTLGAPKKIPVTEAHVAIFSKYNAKYLNYIAAQAVGTEWTKGKGLSLAEGTYELLDTGVSVGCASSLHTARMGKMMPFLKVDSMDWMYTSPKEARQPAALGSYSRYLHALFALREKNITYGNVTFSSILLELLRYIETHWEMLCDDVEHGTVHESIEMPPAERKSVLKKLKPMPKRAAELRDIFRNHRAEPFGKLVWPKLQFFMFVGGASFQTYTDKLLNRYLGREVHILYLGLSSSEGMYSVPLKMDSPDAVFVPEATFCEFIPVVGGERDLSRGIQYLWQLEQGGQYEMIITNVSGLYRYQLKDTVEVTGFHNQTPVMQFVNRSGFAINICAEKTSEKALQFTAEKTAAALGLDMYDYCVCPCQDEKGARYVFLYELSEIPENLSMQQLRDKTEEFIIQANPDYKEELQVGALQPTETRLLQSETFMLYRDLMVMKGRSAAQLKPVHVAVSPFQQKFFLGLTEFK